MLYHLSYVSEARLLLCLLTILRGCPCLLSIYSGLPAATLERETGFEPATPSLEGSCSSQLSYSRSDFWWRGEDSNLRRHKPADLQSAPVGRFGTSPHQNHEASMDAENRLREQTGLCDSYLSLTQPLGPLFFILRTFGR